MAPLCALEGFSGGFMGGSGMAARKWHARGVDMRARAKKYGVVRA